MWNIFVILLIGPATDSNTLKIFSFFSSGGHLEILLGHIGEHAFL